MDVVAAVWAHVPAVIAITVRAVRVKPLIGFMKYVLSFLVSVANAMLTDEIGTKYSSTIGLIEINPILIPER